MISLKDFRGLLKDERGQLDLFGNVIDLIKAQPWILPVLFLALLSATTLPFVFSLGGVELDVSGYFIGVLTAITGFIPNALGIGFDWRLFVIICFLAVPVGFILRNKYLNR